MGRKPTARTIADTLHAQATFATIPTWVLDAPVSDRAVRLYGVIARYADNEGRAWPSRNTLRGRLRCSLSSLDRAVDELVQVGALRVEQHHHEGRQTSNRYYLHVMPAPVDNPVDSDAPEVRGVVTSEHPPSSRVNRGEREPLNETTPNPTADAAGGCPKHLNTPGPSCRACGTNPRAVARAERTRRPPWCGSCDEGTRLVVSVCTDGTPGPSWRCRTCHPLAHDDPPF